MRGIVVAAAALAMLALVQAAHAAGSQTYADTTGDGRGAVDIVEVVIANDLGGPYRIALDVDQDPAPSDATVYAVAFDTDRNPATGAPGGFEYEFVGTSGAAGFLEWDGSAWRDAPSGASFQPPTPTSAAGIWIPQADLGSPASFDFAVVTTEAVDQGDAPFDVAPDRGAWTYTTFAGAAPALLRPAAPATARAGTTFRIPSATIVLDDGKLVRGQHLACRIALGGHALRGTACRVTLPKSARGKLLVVRVTASYGKATITRTLRLRVQ